MGYEVINCLYGLCYVLVGVWVVECLWVEEGSFVCEIKWVWLVNCELVLLEVIYLL